MRSKAITWVGGQHDFALSLPLLDALQERCGGDGVGLIFHRIACGDYKVNDIVATLFLGLEGGGMDRREAVKMVERLFLDHGLNALAIPAQAVLGVALNGWPKDENSGEDRVETQSLT